MLETPCKIKILHEAFDFLTAQIFVACYPVPTTIISKLKLVIPVMFALTLRVNVTWRFLSASII